jgi:hypothetical protein
MTQTITPHPPETSLKFWQSLSTPSTLKTQIPLGLIIAGSAIIHTAFWFLLPNPIHQHTDISNPPKLTTISVVTIPAELKTPRKSSALISNSPNSQLLNLNQIKLPTLPSSAFSNTQNPNNPPPPLLSVAPQNLNRSPNFKTVPEANNLNPNLAINTKPLKPEAKKASVNRSNNSNLIINNSQTNLNIPLNNSNLRPEILNTPEKIPEKSNNLKNPESPKIDSLTGNSLKATDLLEADRKITESNPSNPSKVLLQKQITVPETSLPSNKENP